MCPAQIFPGHVFFAPYTLLAAIIPHPVLPIHITKLPNHIIISAHVVMPLRITNYNIIFISTLSSPHLVMALRITHYKIIFISTLSSPHLVIPLRIMHYNVFFITTLSSPHLVMCNGITGNWK